MSGWTSLIEPLASALGHAVVQSLWQCTLVGAVAAALLLGVRRVSVRYGVWFAAMLVCIGWFGWTFAAGIELPVVGSAGEGGGVIGRPAATIDPGGLRLGLFEIVALLWGIGFLLVSIRYLRQWGAAQRLRRREVAEASGEWAAVFEEMRAALGVSRRVRMLVSGIARCPVVVGVVSPVVIVPSSVLLMMSPEQVRMVLAHELAHIRRYDHVVNMVQVLIETVLFYHPVVWWMSRSVRLEREHCCDDAAVRQCGDARGFARALTELEEIRQSSRALLAINDGGSLMNRVKRIIDGTPNRRGMISIRVLGVLLASMVIGFAACANSALRENTRGGVLPDALRSAEASGETTAEQANERGAVGSEADVETLRFPGLGPDAPEIHREHEMGTFAYLERTLQPTIIEQVIEDVNAGRITEQEGSARLERERRRLRFEARWMNVTDLYQTEVLEGRMTVDEANAYLGQVMEERGYFTSEFAKEDDLQLMKVVDPDQLIVIEVSQDGQPVGAPEKPTKLEIKAVPEKQGRKLTPMDEEFWHFQGIRSLSEYDESFGDDC